MQTILIEDDLVYIGFSYGKAAVIDKIDQDLARFNWSIGQAGYVTRQENNRVFKLHRLVLERKLGRPPEANELCDHINRLPNDNRRANLRLASSRANVWNSSKPKSVDGRAVSSRFKGVSYDDKNRKWRAQIRINGKSHHLGFFDSELDAALAYDLFAGACRGEFATSNCFNNLNSAKLGNI